MEQRIEWIKNKKQEGNDLFAKQNYEEAMKIYMRSLMGLDFRGTEEVMSFYQSIKIMRYEL